MRPGGKKAERENKNYMHTAVQEIAKRNQNGFENKNQPPTKYQVMEGKGRKGTRLTHSLN